MDLSTQRCGTPLLQGVVTEYEADKDRWEVMISLEKAGHAERLHFKPRDLAWILKRNSSNTYANWLTALFNSFHIFFQISSEQCVRPRPFFVDTSFDDRLRSPQVVSLRPRNLRRSKPLPGAVMPGLDASDLSLLPSQMLGASNQFHFCAEREKR